jgi:Flp pilus assembly CpaE family ATPase
MDEIAQPVVITAIADADFEAMVSSALFARGWDIVARPLDFISLEREINTHLTSNLLIIYSVDLPGLTNEQLKRLPKSRLTIFGFADATGSARGISAISPRPNSDEELLSYIRGNIRSPLLRAPLIRSGPTFKAKIIAVGSAGHSTGATTLAINLSQELALLEKNTLLIDANFAAPAVSTLLDLRKLGEEEKWRDLSTNFSAAEVTQNTVTGFPDRAVVAASYFDFIVLDLGSLTNITNDLSDRRWSSQVKIWSSTFAQELLITAGTDPLQIRRRNELCTELTAIKLSAQTRLYCQGSERKTKEDNFQYLPVDARLCATARKDRTTLVEVNEKAPLRKAIAAIARQITAPLQS